MSYKDITHSQALSFHSAQTLIFHKGFSFTNSNHPYPQTLTDSSTSSPPPLKLTHHCQSSRISADPCTIANPIHYPPHPLRSPAHLCRSRCCLP
ncbi:hypothetical protein ACB092_09G117400 [Castanea dentata]